MWACGLYVEKCLWLVISVWHMYVYIHFNIRICMHIYMCIYMCWLLFNPCRWWRNFIQLGIVQLFKLKVYCSYIYYVIRCFLEFSWGCSNMYIYIQHMHVYMFSYIYTYVCIYIGCSVTLMDDRVTLWGTIQFYYQMDVLLSTCFL